MMKIQNLISAIVITILQATMTIEKGPLPKIVAITEQTDFTLEPAMAPSEWVTVFPNPYLSKRNPGDLIQAKPLGRYTALRIPLPAEFFTNRPDQGPKRVVAIVESTPEHLTSRLLADTDPILEQRGRFIRQAIEVLDIAKPGVLKGNLSQVALARSFGTSPHLLSEALKAAAVKKEVYAEHGWNTIKASQPQVDTFISLVGNLTNPDPVYQGIEGQIQAAKALRSQDPDGMNLGDLYGLASALRVAKKLGWKKIALPVSTAGQFHPLVSSDTLHLGTYQGNLGQIQMARELGGPNLGGLYALAKAYGIAEQLGWTDFNTPLEMVEKFLQIVGDPQTPNRRYIGNFGQIQLAREMGAANLQQIYSLGSGLLDLEELGWSALTVPLATAENFLQVVGDLNNPNAQYLGNKGQVQFAEHLGNLHFSQLASLAYGFNIADKLGWTPMSCTYRDFTKVRELLSTPNAAGQLKGTKAQMLLAAKYGLAPGDLYVISQISGQDLGWKDFFRFLDIKYVKALVDFAKAPDRTKFAGNRGQIAAARMLGFRHLQQLYEGAKALGLTEGLAWTASLSVPTATAEQFLAAVETKTGQMPEAYMGNLGQLRLARELGGVHLSNFHHLASVLGLAKKLRWNELYLPCPIAEQALRILQAGDPAVKGNSGLETLAEKLGCPIARLYNFAVALRFQTDLGWTYKFANS